MTALQRCFVTGTPRRFTPRAAHAACSYGTCPRTGQLSSPSRSVATSSGGQQREHRLNPNSPPSVALAIEDRFLLRKGTFLGEPAHFPWPRAFLARRELFQKPQ